MVAGVLAVDITMVPAATSPLRTTAPGKVAMSLGGVAGNVAGAAHAVLASDTPDGHHDVLLLAPVADDTLGDVARSGLSRRGMRTDGLLAPSEARTATCGILLDEKGELVGGIADMDIAHQLDGAEVRWRSNVLFACAWFRLRAKPSTDRQADQSCSAGAGLL